ncbi:MAG: Flp pilus assembly complex ATPase component TadA [Deltaproteobacteria bacterium]|nr:Flp pilus assembly complex ATPase component TadA [Deltaproteobacteria bacterium]
MTETKELTLDYVTALLRKRNMITEAQEREIHIKGEAQRARLKKSQESFYSSRRRLTLSEMVSPAEVVASLNIPLATDTKKPITEDMITEAIAEDAGIPYVKIDPLKLNLDVVTSNVPRPFAQKYLVVPLEEKDKVVTIAVADPFNLEAIESLKGTRKMKIKAVLSSKSDILKIVREFYGFRYSVGAAEKEFSGGTDLGNLEQYVKLRGAVEIEATDQHIVNAVEYLLHYAYDQGASDIHIEPKREKSLVRLRIDGMLHYIHTVPKAVHASILSRIKMLSRMDIAEKRRPQDGRIKTAFKDREVELRVSTLPTAFGEKVVIRIFDPEILFQDVSTLGFTHREFDVFSSFLRKSYGIILVTGPTGSGKTTTLYSAMKSLSTPEVNIVTIEDPIEMIVEEFNQVGVQPLIGVDFAGSLRTILRQDPDIIMVGEIRDKDTAQNAVQAALTGHLVFSTLHTNDAPTSITRLFDLGVPPFLINSTIIGILAQRLVRKICKHCAKQRPLTHEEMEHLRLKPKEYAVSYGEGCTECRGTGYKGRTAVFEVLGFSDAIRRLVTNATDVSLVEKAARAEGMSTLRESAIRKMLQGVTTYEEVVSVT